MSADIDIIFKKLCINKLMLFTLILCTSCISPQKPQYTPAERDARKKSKTSIKPLTWGSETNIIKDDRVSELRELQACKPLVKPFSDKPKNIVCREESLEESLEEMKRNRESSERELRMLEDREFMEWRKAQREVN